MSHIQFKKLVWEETCKKGWWECQTPFAMMNIFFHEEDLGTYYFVLRIGMDQKFRFGSIESCKEKAREWFEEQLTQFIETSENPAQ
jgi:hypothetical protein